MKNVPTRRTFGETLKEMGKQDDSFVVLDADISKSTYSCLFHEEFPERAYNFGIAEQNMMGAAAGMAAAGLTVFATTYAVFASMRALEQIRTFICYPELNVKIAASHGGLQVSSDGASHQGIEDLAIMRALPNMTVVHPADTVSTEKLVYAIGKHQGPLYLRLLRNAVPAVYDQEMDFQIGKGIVVKDEQDADCSIIACGLMVHKALEAAEILKAEDIKVSVIDIHTLKPIDRELIVKSAGRAGAVVTAEDHNIIGGLAGAVAEILGEEIPVPMERIGIRDKFGESGDPEKLFDKYQMNIRHILEAVKRVVARKN